MQWPYAMYSMRNIQNSGILTILFFQVYASIFNHTQRYWGIFTHIGNLIKAYSGLLRCIQHHVLPSHIHNLAIFWALAYLELEAHLKPCETLTWHIQKLAIGHYSAIFRPFRTLCNPCIHRNLAYLESWNIRNPSITASPCIFRTLSYQRKSTNIQNSRHI